MIKKFISITLALVLAVCLTACSGNGGSNNKGEMTLSQMVDAICEGVNVPDYETFDLTSENFEMFAFTPWRDGIEAVCADALIMSSPHSVVLIKTANGDAAEIAADVAANANLRKWICVQADAGKVVYNDTYILLVMTYSDCIDDMVANFEKAVGTSVSELEVAADLVDDSFWELG